MQGMDSLKDILDSRKFVAPDELTVVKNYVRSRYKSDCSVRLEHNNVILTVPGSALAATIQLNRQQLIKACALGDKRLVIRTGK